MPKRKAISARDRFEVFKRDRFTCAYCGGKPPEVVLHVDHITPVAKGGTNDPTNLITSCRDCNLGKSDVPLDHAKAAVTRDTITDLREQREQIEAYQAFLMGERGRREGHADLIARRLEPILRRAATLRERAQIVQFLKELPAAEVMDAVDVLTLKEGLRGDEWRYFCGICWTKIKQSKRSPAPQGANAGPRPDAN
jgi:hypothetical protein